MRSPKTVVTGYQSGMAKSVDRWFLDWKSKDGGKTPVIYL